MFLALQTPQKQTFCGKSLLFVKNSQFVALSAVRLDGLSTRFLAIEFLTLLNSLNFLNFSTFFTCFCGLPRSRKRLLAMTAWQKFTTFTNFSQISTQNAFKILKNSTQRSQNDKF